MVVNIETRLWNVPEPGDKAEGVMGSLCYLSGVLDLTHHERAGELFENA